VELAGDGEQRFSRLFSIYTHKPGLTVGLVSFLGSAVSALPNTLFP
jgi:hypothetical protein